MAALDLTGYKLTFDDEFNNLSVSQTGAGTTWADIDRNGASMPTPTSALETPHSSMQHRATIRSAFKTVCSLSLLSLIPLSMVTRVVGHRV